MSGVKRTPGEWSVRTDGGSITIRNKKQTIARLAISANSQRVLQGLANAYLLAAAPDLVAALKRLLTLCESGADPFEEPNRAVVSQSLRAIARAEGRGP